MPMTVSTAVASVNCRAGSSEIVDHVIRDPDLVNCRAGSSEMELALRLALSTVNCRAGSSERPR